MTGSHAKNAPRTSGKLIRWAFWYDVLVGLLTLGREKRMREITLDLVGLRPGERVLDVGCGTGSLAIAAKKRVGPAGMVDGTDAAPEMIARSRKKAARAGAEVHFETAVIESLPFGDGEFDVVLSSLMIHHLPRRIRPAAFAEVFRVLRPGGRFLAVDFKPPASKMGKSVTAQSLGEGMARNDIRKNIPALEAAGFRVLASGPTRYWLLAYILMERVSTAS